MLRKALILSVFLSTSTHAADRLDDKLCVFSAAQKLPAIAGMTVVASRVATSAPNVKLEPNMVIVELDVKGAGQDATFSFFCGVTPGQPPFIKSIGLTK